MVLSVRPWSSVVTAVNKMPIVSATISCPAVPVSSGFQRSLAMLGAHVPRSTLNGITMIPSPPRYSISLQPCCHINLFPGFSNFLSLTPLWISKAHSLISNHQEHLELSLSRASYGTEERKSCSLPVVSVSSLSRSQRRIGDRGRPPFYYLISQ